MPGRRYILTGTPAPNGLGDLHGQVRILDDGAALGGTLKSFRERFCSYVPNGFGGDWVVRTGAREEILRRVAPLVVRLDARDYLELPELVHIDVPVRLPAAAAATYGRLRDALVLELEAGAVVASSAAALSGKLRQVASGSVYLTPDDEVSDAPTRRSAVIHDAKTRALVDLHEELGGKPLLVAYEFEHQRHAIVKAFGRELPYIAGGVSAARGAELEREWNAGRLPLLLVQPQAVAHGLNLQVGGSRLAFFAPIWDRELFDQLIARLWRQGQAADRVFIYHLVAVGTAERRVAAALRAKGVEQGAFLEALRGALKSAD
jgi:SNF2 family DNA or RNA helicase